MARYTRRQLLEVFGWCIILGADSGYLLEKKILRPQAEQQTFMRARNSTKYDDFDEEEHRELVKKYHDQQLRRHASTAGATFLGIVAGIYLGCWNDPPEP